MYGLFQEHFLSVGINKDSVSGIQHTASVKVVENTLLHVNGSECVFNARHDVTIECKAQFLRTTLCFRIVRGKEVSLVSRNIG